MDLDLRICASVMGLSALLSALGGLSLITLENCRYRNELRHVLLERAETLSVVVQTKTEENAGRTMEAFASAMETLRNEVRGVESVFIWRRGRGVIWRVGRGGPESFLTPESRWMGPSGKSRMKRGWFEQARDGRTVVVGWARTPTKDICGFTLDPDGSGCVENPAFRFAVGAGLMVVLGAGLTCGSVFLVRCVRCARAETARKSEFVSLLSHELRTPFASVLPNLEMLIDGTVSEPEARLATLKTVQSECLRMSRMVSRLLAFSRLERGLCHLAPETADLAEAAQSVREAMGPRFVEDSLRVSGEPSLAAVADYDALIEILTILVDNAEKYAAHAGPVELNVGAVDARRAFVQVLDRGPGLGKEGARRAFEKFWRGTDMSGQGGGLGIGLAFARELARRMDGEVSYRPRPGGGSIFELELERSMDNG